MGRLDQASTFKGAHHDAEPDDALNSERLPPLAMSDLYVRRNPVPTIAKIILAIVAIGLGAVLALMLVVEGMHQKSRREIVQLVSEIEPGSSLSSVVSRFGEPSRVYTSPPEIKIMGTTEDDHIVSSSTLYLFMHRAVPLRWICVYVEPASETVIYASWRDT
jgi:hypothetical protein